MAWQCRATLFSMRFACFKQMCYNTRKNIVKVNANLFLQHRNQTEWYKTLRLICFTPDSIIMFDVGNCITSIIRKQTNAGAAR